MNTQVKRIDAAKRAIALLGGPVKAAKRLSVPGHRYQVVQGWLKTRVPAEYCPLIELETGRQIRCEELRPDIRWDALRESATGDTREAA